MKISGGTTVNRVALRGAALLLAGLISSAGSAQSISLDVDNDGVGNATDNCLNVANPAQIDADSDGYGNLCDGDLNNDGLINFIDISAFSMAFLGTDPVADLNSDGAVNFIDLSLLTAQFLSAPGPSGVAAGALTVTGAEIFQNVNLGTAMRMKMAPGDNNRWYVLQRQGGMISIPAVDNTSSSTPVLTISSVDTQFEGGALGFAFHPDFVNNGYLYVSYTADGPPGSGIPLISRISRFETSPNANGVAIADAASELIMISVNQPFANHNGGDLNFGLDGYLYWGLGDGGSGGDPQRHGQNTATLLGSMLRLDIDVSAAEIAAGTTYKIPADNPFAANSDCTVACPEIFAWGLRNPWRFSFDRETGIAWAGDVGQNAIEEITIVPNGGNLGWRCYEGNQTFNTNGCDLNGAFEDPVHTYSHSLGFSITGGYVYRGSAYPAFRGMYVFGDFGSSRIWGLYEGDFSSQLLSSGGSLVSFAEDADGELYYINLGGSSRVFRLEVN